jgi:ribosomal protein S18 acetylase RimI-like enzyme
MQIRRLTDEDWRAFRDLRLAALRDEPSAFGSDADYEAKLGDDWFRQVLRANRVFASFRAGAMVGTAAWRQNTTPRLAHVGSIWGMYVAPAERSRGTGQALLDAVIADATPIVEALKLSVTAGNGSAVRLYERCGFVLYGTEPRTLKLGDRYYDTELRIRSLR